MDRKFTPRSRHGPLAAIVLGLAACGGEKAKSPDSAAPATRGRVDAPGKDTITIAMIAKSSTNPVFLAARTGAEAAAKELSEKNDMQVNVVVAHAAAGRRTGSGAAHSAGRERRRGRDSHFVLRRRKGHRRDQRRRDRGVPVMTFDSDAPQSKRFAYYGVDDIKTGQQVMAELAKLMDGKGKVAILAGNQNAPNLQQRVQGVKDEAAKYPRHHDRRDVQPRRDAAGRRSRSGAGRTMRIPTFKAGR